jgi:superfamily II DNA helicase RecQ
MQKEIIQNVLERKDSMAVLPTGFGKSMCYVPSSHFEQGMANLE